jgi:hypothetical protein
MGRMAATLSGILNRFSPSNFVTLQRVNLHFDEQNLELVADRRACWIFIWI